jgi:hypothetical protein
VQVQVHSHKATLMSEAMTVANGLFAVGLGLLIGIPIAVAAGMLLFQSFGKGLMGVPHIKIHDSGNVASPG